MSPAVPLHLLRIAKWCRKPGQTHRHHPTPERAAGTPAHLPAMPSTAKRKKKMKSNKKRTGQILCPIRHFWGSSGKPLGMEREEETGRRGTAAPGRAPRATQGRQQRGGPGPAPITKIYQPGATHRQGYRGHTLTQPGAVPRSQVPAMSNKRRNSTGVSTP